MEAWVLPYRVYVKIVKSTFGHIQEFFLGSSLMSLETFMLNLAHPREIQKDQKLKEKFAHLLFDEYYSKIYHYFYFATRSKETAEEETQEVLLKVLNAIALFNPEKAKLKTWIWIIAKRHLIDHYRLSENKINKENFQEETHSEEIVGDELLSQELEIILAKEQRENIRSAIDQLPSTGKEILLLWLESDLSMDELAEIQEMSVQQIKNHLFQSKKKLKGLLGQEVREK